jgi:predicted Zn-ribbon and HTH transcriptional regulator
MFPNKGVQVTCKHCGKQAFSTDFILDPVYKQMVCKNCVSERQLKENPIKPGTSGNTVALKSGSALAKQQSTAMVKQAQTSMIKQTPTPIAKTMPAQKIVATSGDKTRKKCGKCGFAYQYNAEKRYPPNCPNCGSPSVMQPGKFY